MLFDGDGGDGGDVDEGGGEGFPAADLHAVGEGFFADESPIGASGFGAHVVIGVFLGDVGAVGAKELYEQLA